MTDDRERDLIKFLEDTPEGELIHVVEARSVTTGKLLKTGVPGERKVRLKSALIQSKFAAMIGNTVVIDFDNIVSWGLGKPAKSL